MKGTMKALVVYGKDEYRFEPEFPIPECGPDDLLIKAAEVIKKAAASH